MSCTNAAGAPIPCSGWEGESPLPPRAAARLAGLAQLVVRGGSWRRLSNTRRSRSKPTELLQDTLQTELKTGALGTDPSSRARYCDADLCSAYPQSTTRTSRIHATNDTSPSPGPASSLSPSSSPSLPSSAGYVRVDGERVPSLVVSDCMKIRVEATGGSTRPNQHLRAPSTLDSLGPSSRFLRLSSHSPWPLHPSPPSFPLTISLSSDLAEPPRATLRAIFSPSPSAPSFSPSSLQPSSSPRSSPSRSFAPTRIGSDSSPSPPSRRPLSFHQRTAPFSGCSARDGRASTFFIVGWEG
jgi:hypothetical protein